VLCNAVAMQVNKVPQALRVPRVQQERMVRVLSQPQHRADNT
jgi:hypothetical protein